MTAVSAIVLAIIVAGGIAHASVVQSVGPPVGPASVSPLGHPGLCWQAGGNGSAITLEACETAVQGQLWTFTSNGVLMNGNGYCLQNGGPSQSDPQPNASLFLSFSGQCAAAASQEWTFSGVTSGIKNTPDDLCAYVQGGGLVPGAEIVGRRCGSTGSGDMWSQGVSDLTLSGASRSASTRAQRPASTRRAFTAEVTVSNAARATTAYAASVTVRPPSGLTVTKLAGTGDLSNWTCTVRMLKCSGNLVAGSSGQITIGGTVASRSPADAMTAHAAVMRTNQARHAIRSAAIPVRVFAMTTGGAAQASPSHGALSSSTVTFGVIVAGLLLALGIFLAIITRRRQQPATPTLAGPGAED